MLSLGKGIYVGFNSKGGDSGSGGEGIEALVAAALSGLAEAPVLRPR